MFWALIRCLRKGLLIDVLILLALVLATEQVLSQQPMGDKRMKNVSKRIEIIGPQVTDLVGHTSGKRNSGASKFDTHFVYDAGGGCTNSAGAAKSLGAEVQPVFMTGPEPIHPEVLEKLEVAFPNAVWWQCLAHSRLSVVIEPICYVERSVAVSHEIPVAVADALQEAEWAIVAPMMAADKPLVSRLLKIAKRSLLMLSLDQLQKPADCLSLMSQADVTVMNETELEQGTSKGTSKGDKSNTQDVNWTYPLFPASIYVSGIDSIGPVPFSPPVN